MLRFAFAGLDHWYNALPMLEALLRTPDVRVVALAHRDAGRAREIGERYGVPVAPSYDEVIARDDVDAVCCFTSIDEAAGIAVRALAADKSVVAIKPLAMTLADADRVVDAARRAKGRYLPNDAARRFFPAIAQAKRWLAEGRFGELVLARCALHAGLPRAWPDAGEPGWFADPRRAPGGAFIDHAIYHVDVLRWLFGAEVASVSAAMASIRYRDLPVEDWGQATLRFANGAVATVEDSWLSAPGAARETFEIVGTRGALAFDTASGRLTFRGGFEPEGWLQMAPPAQAGFVDHVLSVLRGEAEPISSAAEARANLAVCLAAYEAVRSGGVVTPAPPEEPR